MTTETLYHVTSSDAAEIILKEGFLGNWGDDGFGVYFFSNELSARSYAIDGGWDGSLDDPVILAVEAASSDIAFVIPNPEWPNPEDYEDVRVFHMDDSDPDTLWKPASVQKLAENTPLP